MMNSETEITKGHAEYSKCSWRTIREQSLEVMQLNFCHWANKKFSDVALSCSSLSSSPFCTTHKI